MAGAVITLGQSGFPNTGLLQFTGAAGGSSDRAIVIQSNTNSGNGGVIDGTRRTLEAFSAVKACGDLVVSGWASSVGEPTRWYSTRHDPTSGALAVEPRTACTERTRR